MGQSVLLRLEECQASKSALTMKSLRPICSTGMPYSSISRRKWRSENPDIPAAVRMSKNNFSRGCVGASEDTLLPPFGSRFKATSLPQTSPVIATVVGFLRLAFPMNVENLHDLAFIDSPPMTPVFNLEHSERPPALSDRGRPLDGVTF